MKILCVCLSTTIQRTLTFKNFEKNCVNRTADFIENASGKAINTARVLNQLEKNSAIAVCPAGIQNLSRLKKLLKQDKLNVNLVKIPGSTRECWTLLSKDGQTTEVIADEKAEPSDNQNILLESQKKLLKKIRQNIKNCDALILAGSCPSCFDKNLPVKICEIAKKMKKTILADFQGLTLLQAIKIATPDIIKINEEEFFNTFGVSSNERILNEQTELLKNTIIVTRGPGKTLASSWGKTFECESEKLTPVNTTACGDSFNAGFIYSWLQTKDLQKALEKGTYCAARNALCKVPGSLGI